MKIDRMTGLLFHGKQLDWTCLRSTKSGLEQASAGNLTVDTEEDASPTPSQVSATVETDLIDCAGPVTVGLSSDNMLMRVVTLPTTDPEEIESMVKLQVDKLSPFPEDKIALSFETLDFDEISCSLFVGAVHKDIVESIGQTIDPTPLTLHRIDSTVPAWWNALKRVSAVKQQGRQLLLIFADTDYLLVVAQDGVPLAFRSLMRESDSDSTGYVEEVMEDIASLLLTIDLEHAAMPVSSTTIWHGNREFVKGLASRMGEEFNVDSEVKELDDLPSLSHELALRALQDFPAKPGRDRGFRGTGARIDFLPEKWRILATAKRVRKAVILLSGIVLLVWALGMGVFLLALKSMHSKLEQAELKQEQLEIASGEVRVIRDHVIAFEQYLDRTQSALECLREISAVLPGEIDLSAFQYRKARNLTLRGESLSVNPIYDFKEALDKSELFSAVTMGTVRPSNRDGATVQTFQIAIRMPEVEE